MWSEYLAIWTLQSVNKSRILPLSQWILSNCSLSSGYVVKIWPDQLLWTVLSHDTCEAPFYISDHVASANTAFFVAFDKSGNVKSSHTKFQTTSDKSDDIFTWFSGSEFKAIFNKSDYVAPFDTACCSRQIWLLVIKSHQVTSCNLQV